MQDRAAGADEAAEWLKGHFADDPAPVIDIRWTSDDSDTGWNALPRLLFSPATDTPAA